MMYYTYVLLGQDKKTKVNKFYVGSTKDLANRLREHQAGEIKTTKKFEKLHSGVL